jgi:RHS repeat-associated protein
MNSGLKLRTHARTLPVGLLRQASVAAAASLFVAASLGSASSTRSRQPTTLPVGPILILPAPEFTEQPATTPTSPYAYCMGLNCAPPMVSYPPSEPVDPGIHCSGIACGNLTPAITPAPGAPAGPPACAGMSCGLLIDPIAPSGGGTSPGSPCMGLNCGGSPGIPPSPPGPVPSGPVCSGMSCGLPVDIPVGGNPKPNPGPPACMSMNCPGQPGGNEWRQTCTSCGVGPNPRDLWCGPGVPTSTQHPVDFSTGYKLETATDLVVPLPGPDFVLARSYSSQVKPDDEHDPPIPDTNLGLPKYSGWHWALNISACLYIDGYENEDTVPPPYIALSTPGGTTRFNYDSATDSWRPTGGSAQVITRATLTVGSDSIPVWRMVEPGAWTVDYDRRRSNTLGTMGLPIEERDSYGHVRHFVWAPNMVAQAPQLTHLYLGAQTKASSKAWVDFTWNSDGRLGKAEVFRSSGATDVLVSKVEYTYFEDSHGYSGDVGTAGDLIQVQTWQPVDKSEDTSSGNQLWHVVTTQYRYYDGSGYPTSTDPPLGKAHQLKSVISAQQIEFAAQRTNAGGTPAWNTVKNFADTLLTREDTYTVFTEGSTGVTVRDLASKVIVQYDAGDRVLAQDLLTGCGCSGGGSTLGTRETYEYIAWPSGTPGRTMVVHENVKNGSGDWEPVRTRFHDLQEFEPSSGVVTYMQVYNALGLGDGSAGPYWASRIDYTTTAPARRISAMYGPNAISAYTPAAGGSSPAAPTATVSTSAGMHSEYTYTASGRLATVTVVKQGSSPQSSIVLRNTYDSSRPWLPTRSEIATEEGMSASDMSNPAFAGSVQKVEFSYGCFSGGFGTANPDAIAWMEARFEAETVGENGPGGNYASHTLFSEDGFPVFQRLADDALVRRTFDGPTGATLSIESNAPNTGISSMPHPSPVSGLFTWDGRNSSGGSLTWSMTYDVAGRLRTMTTPSGAVNRFTRELRAFNSHLSSGDGRPGVLYFALVGLPFQVSGTSEDPMFVSPASVTWSDAAGVLVGACDYKATAKEDSYKDIFPSWPYTLTSTPAARRAMEVAVTGQLVSSTVWHDMDGRGDGNGRYQTKYAYDAEGRIRQVVSPNRTIERTAYDQLGRVKEVSVGAYASGGDPDAASTLPVAAYRYDGATGSTLTVGNGLLTAVDEYTGASSTAVRTTTYLYDWRSRLAAVTNPVPPHAVIGYDNVGRVTQAASLSTAVTSVVAPDSDSIASTRLSFAGSAYSQRGTQYRTRIALVPTSTSMDDPRYTEFVESHLWYDPAGRIVGAWGPSAPMVKNSIDGLGRVSAAYVVDRDTDRSPGTLGNYADVFDRATSSAVLSKNVVLEQTFPQFRSGLGLLDLVKHQSRVHTLAETVKGDIDGATKSITTWLAYEYDAAGRTLRTLDFGTNLAAGFNGGGTAPTSSGTPPAWSGSVTPLVSGMEYDELGRATVTVAPKDSGAPLKSRIYYDAMGGVVGTIANWTGGAYLEWSTALGFLELKGSDPTKPDENQAASVRARLTDATPAVDQIAYTFELSSSAWVPKYQTTRTTYGVTSGTGPTDSRVTSNDVVALIDFQATQPPSSPSGDVRLFAYDRQGAVRWSKDQRGVEHAFTLDGGGRLTLDDATGGGGETDGWADAVAIAYDANGRVATVKTLKHNTSPTPDTVLNAVGMHYSALGLLDQFDQNPLGDLTYTGGTTPSGTTKRVAPTYDTAKSSLGNWIRMNGMVYPSGHSLDLSCGTSGTSYRISRYRSVGFHSATAAAEYQFLGAATPVVTTYPAPGIRLDRSMAQAGTTADGQYPGLDSFGRVVRQLWVDNGYAAGSVTGFANKPAVVDTTYSYTRLSALTGKLDARPGATMLAQHAYALDGLLRLLGDQRGTVAFPSSQAKPGSQEFSYDFIGNMPETKTDTSAAGTFSAGSTDENTGTFDLVNQVASGGYAFPSSGTQRSLSFTWDAAGNLQQRSIPDAAGGAPTRSWSYRHDRWGRLTQVDLVDGATAQPALRAQYNALGMRCVVDRAPDTWAPPAAPTISQRRLGYFTAGWQLVEEHVDNDLPLATDATDIDEVDQLVWGLRHVDDLVLRRVNANYSGGSDTDWTDAGDRPGDQFLNDVQFSVVAVVDQGGALLERVEYDSYGHAQHHWPEGITGAAGGGVVSADATAAAAAENKSIGDSLYNSDADLNRNGTVSSAEVAAITAKVGTAGIPAGRISAYGSTVGWCGYAFNAGTNLYTVRFRHYEPANGMARWLERDPAGYMAGPSLYAYGFQAPTLGGDPTGLLPPSVIYLRNRDSNGSRISDTYWHHREGDRGQGGWHAGPRKEDEYMDDQLERMQSENYARMQSLSELAGDMRVVGETAQELIGMVVTPIGVVQDAANGNALGVVLGVIPMGQAHHVFSTKIFRAMQEHKVLRGLFKRNDARYIVRAIDKAAHRGYQTWHRELEDEVVRWLADNPDATEEMFERYIRRLYKRPDIKARFPLGPCSSR